MTISRSRQLTEEQFDPVRARRNQWGHLLEVGWNLSHGDPAGPTQSAAQREEQGAKLPLLAKLDDGSRQGAPGGAARRRRPARRRQATSEGRSAKQIGEPGASRDENEYPFLRKTSFEDTRRLLYVVKVRCSNAHVRKHRGAKEKQHTGEKWRRIPEVKGEQATPRELTLWYSGAQKAHQ